MPRVAHSTVAEPPNPSPKRSLSGPVRESEELLSPRPRAGRYPTWTALSWLFLFRLLLVVALVLIFAPARTDPMVASADLSLAWRVLVIYAVLVLSSGLNLYARWPGRDNQVYLAVCIDILTFTVLMHAGGGVGSGLGLLIAVSVAAGALMMEGRLSLLFASVATLAVIAEHTYTQLQGQGTTADYTQVGLLGVTFFAVALLAHVLYRRVCELQKLAARRKVDIDDLSKLNEYIIQTMETGVLVVDGDRRVRLMNQAVRDLLEVATTRPGVQLGDIAPGLADWLGAHVRPGTAPSGTVRAGERELIVTLYLLGDLRAAGLLLFLRDNREILKEAQQIKLASLGTLTASIAHNIRNPLGAVSHAAQLLAESESLSSDDRYLLDIVQRNTKRIDEIVSSVLQLSRRNQMEAQTLELVAWTAGFCEELSEAHRLPSDRLVLEVDPPPIEVEVDPRHLHQIVGNLCENALIHGCQPGQPASLKIRVGRGGGSGPAMLEVCDDGPGIDETTARDVFSPFFTTKASGTGLGLYIARELAETNGIALGYERLAPRGSCFRLVFER